MINKRTISLNILFSLLQILVTGIAYYFLYKFLLLKMGPDLMGVWAIVLSISSSVNIANLGIGVSVVRFTAKFKATGELDQINKLVHTSFLFLGGIFLAIIFIVYLVAPAWLHAVIKTDYYHSAIELIPYSLLCLMLNALSGIFISCIDGLQKNYIRSLIFIISFVILIAASYLLVPQYGLMGVAYAQLIQAAFILLSSVICLKLIFRPLKLFPLTWSKTIFKNIFSFGMQEQIISIAQLCFDPFTKSILGSFGNLGMVTYYEMANRLVTQLRGFLISANQVFIPAFTSSNEKSAETAHHLYKKVFSISFLLSILWLSFIIASVIPISKVWIGELNIPFIIITTLLALAYWCNIVISPAYFANMGSASLKNNVISNIIIAVLNILLCFGLGYFFKGYGVVVGWSLALALGSLYVIYKYHLKNKIGITEPVTKKDVTIIVISFLYCLFCLLLFWFKSDLNVWLMFGIDLFAFLGVCTVVLYIHPVSKIILNIIKRNPGQPG